MIPVLLCSATTAVKEEGRVELSLEGSVSGELKALVENGSCAGDRLKVDE